MTMDIMVDLETLGTQPGAPIFAIGAVAFDPNIVKTDWDPQYSRRSDQWLAERFAKDHAHDFYARIDISGYDFRVNPPDGDTLKFWFDQPPLARAEITRRDTNVFALPAAALWALCEFFGRVGFDKHSFAWAKPSKFDFPLLDALLLQFHLPTPWDHRQAECARAMYRMAGINEDTYRTGTAHNALDDAVAQTAALIDALQVFANRQLAAKEKEIRDETAKIRAGAERKRSPLGAHNRDPWDQNNPSNEGG